MKNAGGKAPTKLESTDELEELIDSSIKKEKKKESTFVNENKKDSDFLEPYPVIKKRSAMKEHHDKKKDISHLKYDPPFVNKMDLGIRDSFS